MSDLISRQAAIDAMCKVGCGSVYCGISCDEVKAIEQLPSAQPDNQVHLCDSCRYVYPACPSGKDDVIFGNGKGNDNICACNKYEPSEQPKIIRYEGGYLGTVTDEIMPYAQPEIIRCKDCKHRPVTNDNYDDDEWDCGFNIEFPDYRCPCQCEDTYYNRLPDDDWFCGNAERRTDA